MGGFGAAVWGNGFGCYRFWVPPTWLIWGLMGLMGSVGLIGSVQSIEADRAGATHLVDKSQRRCFAAPDLLSRGRQD